MQQLDHTAPSDSPHAPDARLNPRTGCEEPIQIVPCEGVGAGGLQTVRVIDYSSRGMGLMVSRPMRPGSQFVTNLDAEPVHHRLYTVRFCRKMSQGSYRVGAELVGHDRG